MDRVAIVFNKGGKLIPLIEQMCTELRAGPQRRNGPPPRHVEVDKYFKLNPNERSMLNNELKNLQFEVDHISYKPKSKIFCITENTVNNIFFDQKVRDSDQVNKVSVKEYFEKTYSDYLDKRGRGGLLPNLPCIQVGKTNPKFIPFEVVSIIEDQYSMKKLKPRQQAEMTKTCGQQKPTERFEEGKREIKRTNELLSKAGQTDYLKQFGIKMESEYTEVRGRLLDAPKLQFSGNRTNTPREGKFENV